MKRERGREREGGREVGREKREGVQYIQHTVYTASKNVYRESNLTRQKLHLFQSLQTLGIPLRALWIRSDDPRDISDLPKEGKLSLVELEGRAGHGRLDLLCHLLQLPPNLWVSLGHLFINIHVGLHVPQELCVGGLLSSILEFTTVSKDLLRCLAER